MDSNDIQHFNHSITNLDPHHFSSENLLPSETLDPLSARSRDIRKLAKRPGLDVYKRGAATDVTLGYLVKITQEPPKGWYEREETESGTEEWRDEVSTDDEELDDEEWIGFVKWTNIPFTAPGDSGSLMFALESGVTVPLGIHYGDPESIPNHSIFFLHHSRPFVMKGRNKDGNFNSHIANCSLEA